MTNQQLIYALSLRISSLTLSYVESDQSVVIAAEAEGFSSTFRLKTSARESLSPENLDLIADRLVVDWALRRYRTDPLIYL